MIFPKCISGRNFTADDEVFKDAVSAFLAFDENTVFCFITSKTYFGVHNKSLEFSFCHKSRVFFLTRTVPIGNAAVIAVITNVFRHIKACRKVVAITGVVPVVACVVKETAAVLVIRIITGVKRVDVTHYSARSKQLNADKNVCNSHICQRIVAALDQYSYGVRFSVSDYIYSKNVCV